ASLDNAPGNADGEMRFPGPRLAAEHQAAADLQRLLERFCVFTGDAKRVGLFRRVCIEAIQRSSHEARWDCRLIQGAADHALLPLTFHSSSALQLLALALHLLAPRAFRPELCPARSAEKMRRVRAVRFANGLALILCAKPGKKPTQLHQNLPSGPMPRL